MGAYHTGSEGLATLLDLREIRRSDEWVNRTVVPTDFPVEPGGDYAIAKPVVIRLRVEKDGDKYRLVGNLGSTVRLSCCRCLESFDVPVDLLVDLLYLPQNADGGEGECEITDEDLSSAFYRDDQIDLGLMVHEQLQLALPMKPLCREVCRGLCSVCGVNLNSERCSCDSTWHDPRLDVLESLLSNGRKG